jgi:hypothetical protein
MLQNFLKRELGVARLLPVLCAVPTLATLSPFQLLPVALQMTKEDYGIQDTIFTQDVDDDRGLFVVREGSVQLTCNWFEQHLEAKLPGQGFGLDGPLAACPRTVSIPTLVSLVWGTLLDTHDGRMPGDRNGVGLGCDCPSHVKSCGGAEPPVLSQR